MNKFTPGPWEACAVDGGWDGVKPIYQKTPICNLVENNPANAQLIAAAPTMLEALEMVADWNGDPDKYLNLDEVRAAIRAAKGE